MIDFMAADKKIKIPIDRLRIGMYVDLELSWVNHPFLFSRFKLKSEKDLAAILHMGLTEISVVPQRSNKDSITAPAKPEVVTETPPEEDLWEEKKELQAKARKYRDRHKNIAEKYSKQTDQVKAICRDLKTQPANAIHHVEEVIDGLASEIENADQLLTNLVNLGSGEHNFYNHNINVTVLSLMLGLAAGFKGDALRQLAVGALLHDIGKIEIPPQVVNKIGKLTPPEQTLLRRHPSLGRLLTERVRNMPSMSRAVIEFHHEMMDGSGYPHGVGGERIPKQVRIVTIANLYDNLCNASDPAKSLTPKLALALMYKKYSKKLDPELVELFVRNMGVYPPGTVVQLNDDSIGLVVTANSAALLKPELLLYSADVPKESAMIINMVEQPDLEIVTVLKPGDYPSRIYEYLGIEQRLGYLVEGK